MSKSEAPFTDTPARIPLIPANPKAGKKSRAWSIFLLSQAKYLGWVME
jgi:hypothetical protein